MTLSVIIVKPWQGFASAFDANLANNAHFDTALVIGDPALHDHLLQFTTDAYEKGGWPAASTTLKMVMISDVLPYARDDQVLAYEKAKFNLVTKLASNPETCLRYVIDGGDPGTFRSAEAEVSALNDITWKAVQTGLERKKQGVVWHSPTHAQVDALWRAIEFGRYPLSRREIDLLTYARSNQVNPSQFPSDILCSAAAKAEQNLLAFVPESDAAFAARIMMSEMNKIASLSHVKQTHTDVN